jgi:hypothetical protein
MLSPRNCADVVQIKYCIKNDIKVKQVNFSNIKENQNPSHMHITTFCKTRTSTLNFKKILYTFWLIIYCVYVLFRWRTANFRPMLSAQGLWATGNLYRATVTVTRGLGFSGLIQRMSLTTYKGMWRTYSNPDLHVTSIELVLSILRKIFFKFKS